MDARRATTADRDADDRAPTRPEDHHQPLRRAPTATPTTRYVAHRRLRRRCARPLSTDDAGRRCVDEVKDGQPARPRRRRLPGRREVGLPARPTCARATSSSTATRASPAPTRTACSSSAIRTSSSRASSSPATRSAARRRSSTCAARWRSAQERIAAGAQRGVRRRLRRQEHPRLRLLASTSSLHWGAGAYIVRRGDGADREPRGQAGHAAAQAAVLPRGQGPVPAADDRQQRRDAVEPAVDRRRNGGDGVRRARRRDRRPGTRMFAVSGHVEPARRTTRSSRRHDVPRPDLRRPTTAAASATATQLKAFIPGGASSPWFYRGAPRPAARQADASARPARCSAPGAIMVMDETTDMVQACLAPRAVLRPRVVRQVHAVPRGHRLAREDPVPHRRTATAGPSDLDLLLDVGDNISPGLDVAAAADDDLPARPVGRVADRVGAHAASATSSRHYIAHGRSMIDVARRRRSPMSDTPAEAPTKTTVTVTVDGRDIEAKPGELLIDAAEQHGIYIPRFCYHERMKPVGMCRMCLVEVDTGRGPALQPRVHDRRSPTAWRSTPTRRRSKKAQDGVLEFLLDQPPARLPGVRQGRRVPAAGPDARASARARRRFVEEKRHFEKPIPISDLVLLDRERCIQCDRCTRFAEEVAGDPLIDFVDRGNQHAGQHLPRRAVRVVLLRQHRADLPGRRAHRQAVPVQGPPVGPRAGRAHVHDVRGRLPRSRCSRRRNQRAALPRRRHRPGELGLAVRQGPLRLRGGRQRRAPRRAAGPQGRRRSSRRRGPRRSTPRPTALRDGARPPAARRRSPCIGGAAAHQRGRVRLGEARQGRDRHRQRRRPARRRARPPRSSLGLPTATDRRGVRGRHAARARARPQGGAAGPVPAPARRASRSTGCASIELSPTRDRRSRRSRRASLRYRPGEQAALVRVTRSAGGTARPRASTRDGSRRPATSSCIVGRPSLAEPADADRGRDRRCSSRPARRPGSSSRCAAATCTARSTWASRPACCPAGSTLDAGRDWFAAAWGARARRGRASTPTGILAGRGRRHASTCSCCSAPTRWPTSPTATSPERALDRRRHGRSPSTRSSPTSTAQADVVLAGRRLRARSAARPPTSRAASAALGQKVTAAGHGAGRLDDRGRARAAASAPTSASRPSRRSRTRSHASRRRSPASTPSCSTPRARRRRRCRSPSTATRSCCAPATCRSSPTTVGRRRDPIKVEGEAADAERRRRGRRAVAAPALHAGAAGAGTPSRRRRRATLCASWSARTLYDHGRARAALAVARRPRARRRAARATRPTSTASASTHGGTGEGHLARAARSVDRGRRRRRRAARGVASLGFNRPTASAPPMLIDADRAGHRRAGGDAAMTHAARASIRCFDGDVDLVGRRSSSLDQGRRRVRDPARRR